MHFAVVSCMRNEALFLLEWIAHQRLIGFKTVIVVTNDCTDGTDDICDQLAQVDPDFVHVRNTIEPGSSAQVSGMRRVLALPVLAKVDYLLHCDSDELMQITCASRTLDELVSISNNSDCIALVWRYFGSAGLTEWPGGLVSEKCNRTVPDLRYHAVMHKSLFRPSRFEAAIDHMPKEPVSDDIVLTNSAGEILPNGSLYHKHHARFRGMTPSQFTWENACIYHYAIRSRDVFLMKNLRGDGMGNTNERYYVNSKFWRRSNKNRVLLNPAEMHLQKLKDTVANLRDVGRLAAIETAAYEAFVAAREKYLTPQKIEQLTLS